jgi:YihY family inner membrane protein
MEADSRIGRFVERHPVLRFPVEVVARTNELNGGYAANALALVAFISLFPLLLVIISVTGLLTGSNPQLTDDLIDFLGLTGSSAQTMTATLDRARDSGAAGSIVGLLGMAWSGLSLVGALRYAVNLPHGFTVKGIRARAMGIPWLSGAGVILAISITLSTILNWLPRWTSPLALLLAFAIDVALFAWTFWFLDSERPPPRQLLPGAIVAAVGFGVLKTLGTLLLPRFVADSSATYGALGTVFAILAWLLIFSRIFVYAAVVNAVWADRGAAGAPTGPTDGTAGSVEVDPPQDAQ